jgi:hypothetical protein
MICFIMNTEAVGLYDRGDTAFTLAPAFLVARTQTGARGGRRVKVAPLRVLLAGVTVPLIASDRLLLSGSGGK